jgi:hypothetical protein
MANKISKIIAVDFDGTVVKHRYPKIGETIPYSAEVLRELINNGHRIMLWTMRSGENLNEAIDWFSDKGIILWGVNENPTQHKWSKSNKQFADLYIDDAALGCPTFPDLDMPTRKIVNWNEIKKLLRYHGFLETIDV